MHDFLQQIARGIELMGVVVICLGILYATVVFLLRVARTDNRLRAFENYRSNLGRGILLGLELLVAADIIFTITSELTWESVGLLGLVVVIRTFLSFSLETEIEGVLPWKRRFVKDGDEQER
ncbi:DUF1622 domain-containing protein [Sphingomicrobium sp. XHP0239]|uniref:DUF1622 domain-containing protein n=1 Tax=Sphingomicrobium maritimum TaxID=3133972 RepID=UPI0031CC487E